MKISNKSKIAILIFGTMITAIIVQSFSLNMNYISNQADYADVPPDLERFTIQKINEPLSTGENVIIRPTFSHFDTMPQILYLFTGQDSFAFMDDGAYPDDEANDHEYAAFMQIDIEDFLLDVENRENEIESMEQFIVFDGHEGHFEDSIPAFDFFNFNNFLEVEVQANLILADQCNGNILKQNSLFITDLDVVEDLSRTYCPDDGTGNSVGTPNGIWTFGKFMDNMANTSYTGVSTSDFIKNWLKNYLTNIPSPNGTSLPRSNKRDLILDILIRPWIHKANGVTDVNDFINSSTNAYYINLGNWEDEWDAAPDAELIKNAPFKLTAIANRIDLRNNVGYTNKLFRAGETRFIFTAIILYDIGSLIDDLAFGDVGDIPLNNLNNNGFSDFIDWKGMNVIFEFGNVQTNLCDLKEFAQLWLNLSGLTLGSSAYNSALEDITETVINNNADYTKPNRSALNQLRTNEKIFFNSGSNSLVDVALWNAASWQFRQFEIDKITHQLTLVPLSNTPIVEDYNEGYNSTFNNSGDRPAYYGEHLTNWLFKNKERVKRENYTIPNTYYDPVSAGTYTLLDKTGDVDVEYSFYWDLKYYSGSSIPYFNPTNELVASNTQNRDNGKDIRHKFSLNTCQGCHSGETKTFFTMVSPLNKGESAKYWLTVPETKMGKLDVRNSGVIVPQNFGTTVLGDPNIAPSADRFPNYSIPTSNTRDFVSVSAFITGRTYDGTSFDDDESNPLLDKVADNNMEGLYFVNDPSNSYDPNNDLGDVKNYFGRNDKRHGFNELERRQKDLCDLVQINCTNPMGVVSVLDLIKNLKFMELHE
jgi:hypothetical protein